MSLAPLDTDAAAGMAWWNRLSEMDRLRWLTRAGSACPADAWELLKAASARTVSIPTQQQEGERRHAEIE